MTGHERAQHYAPFLSLAAELGVEPPTPHTCTSQCDRCHTAEHCTPATARRGELLLCEGCARLWDIGAAVFDAVYGD